MPDVRGCHDELLLSCWLQPEHLCWFRCAQVSAGGAKQQEGHAEADQQQEKVVKDDGDDDDDDDADGNPRKRQRRLVAGTWAGQVGASRGSDDS